MDDKQKAKIWHKSHRHAYLQANETLYRICVHHLRPLFCYLYINWNDDKNIFAHLLNLSFILYAIHIRVYYIYPDFLIRYKIYIIYSHSDHHVSHSPTALERFSIDECVPFLSWFVMSQYEICMAMTYSWDNNWNEKIFLYWILCEYL